MLAGGKNVHVQPGARALAGGFGVGEEHGAAMRQDNGMGGVSGREEESERVIRCLTL